MNLRKSYETLGVKETPQLSCYIFVYMTSKSSIEWQKITKGTFVWSVKVIRLLYYLIYGQTEYLEILWVFMIRESKHLSTGVFPKIWNQWDELFTSHCLYLKQASHWFHQKQTWEQNCSSGEQTGPQWLMCMAQNIPFPAPACGFGDHLAAPPCHCHRLISLASPRHATVSWLPTSEQTPSERKTPTFQWGDRGMMSEGGKR